jgi:hypothetical protein
MRLERAASFCLDIFDRSNWEPPRWPGLYWMMSSRALLLDSGLKLCIGWHELAKRLLSKTFETSSGATSSSWDC